MDITTSHGDISQWFADTIDSLKDKKTITVGLAGGTSMDSFYSSVLESPISSLKSIMEEKIHDILWCVTDERVNCDPSERNDEHIWEVFLRPLFEKYGIFEENFLRPTLDSDGLKYMERVGDIDIAFFGMGPDGHTASLFPHHPSLQSEEVGFIKIDNAPKFPPERISLSPKAVQSLPHVCLFAVGEAKKEALANFLDETVSVDDCPAKLLKPEIVLNRTN